MSKCPYLDTVVSHCAGCAGDFCWASGQKKRIANSEDCKTDAYLKCEVYQTKIDPPPPPDPVPESLCPYQGKPPEGRKTCCGLWCYAGNEPIVLPEMCRRWSKGDCIIYLQAKWRGMEFYHEEK